MADLRERGGAFAGGCSGKVGRAELETALAPLAGRRPRSGRGVARVVDLGDAHRVELTAPAQCLVTSADLLYNLCEDPHQYGYVAVVHGLSDIYAVLGTPLWATVTVGTRTARADVRSVELVMRGVCDALRDNGAVLAGGHTVYAHDPFIGVAASGRAAAERADSAPRAGDAILLSKPLGTGIALSAVRLGLVLESQLRAEYASMRASNGVVAALLRAALCRQPGCVRYVTDVSGFGLLAALRQGLARGSRAKAVLGESIPAFALTFALIEQGAWSALADDNMAGSMAYVSSDGGPLPLAQQILLNDPQTSGGLLAIVSAQAAVELLEEAAVAGAALTEVGRIEPAAPGERGAIVVSASARAAA